MVLRQLQAAAARIILPSRRGRKDEEPPGLEAVLRQPIFVRPPLELAPRSVVAHVVLGSEALGLGALPPELQLAIFSACDPPSLCRLAQVSKWCGQLADDSQVWLAASSSWPVECEWQGERQGERQLRRSPSMANLHARMPTRPRPDAPASRARHPKELMRCRFLRAAQRQAEARAAEERNQMRRRRRIKRRAVRALSALVGVGAVLAPIAALLLSRRAARRNAVAATRAPPARAAGARTPDTIGVSDIMDIVWGSAPPR